MDDHQEQKGQVPVHQKELWEKISRLDETKTSLSLTDGMRQTSKNSEVVLAKEHFAMRGGCLWNWTTCIHWRCYEAFFSQYRSGLSQFRYNQRPTSVMDGASTCCKPMTWNILLKRLRSFQFWKRWLLTQNPTEHAWDVKEKKKCLNWMCLHYRSDHDQANCLDILLAKYVNTEASSVLIKTVLLFLIYCEKIIT